MSTIRRSLGIGALTMAIAGAGILVPAAADAAPIEAGITVEKVEGLPADFINGVDVSSILSLEASGVVFRDATGEPADIFRVMADAGVTDVRIRVWNDPFDGQGNGYGGGNVDVARGVEIGERATAAGLDVLVNFHYSDFWADPGKQMAPKAWADRDVNGKAAALEEFTVGALEDFRDAGVDVTMVQVGNETNSAMSGVSGWDDMATLFNAGAKAVRQVLPDAKVALHFTNPERAGFYASVASALDLRDVDYDVFASSYYPFWHGSLANLTSVLDHVATTYGKDVAVVETSWAHTLDDGDGHENTIRLADQATAYPVSVEGQAVAVRDVIQATVDAGGIGVYYWEPAWLPVGPPSDVAANKVLWERDGSGWATSHAGEYDPRDAGQWYGGSAWDNQALFDYAGNPLESLNVFSYARTGTIAVEPAANVLVNPGFEDEDTSMWEAAGEGLTIRSTDDPRSGTYSAHFWHDSAYEFTLSQSVSGLEPGEYSASAFLQGGGQAAEDAVVLRIETSSGETAEAPFTMSGWQVWSNPAVGPFVVEDGDTVTVSVVAHLSDGAWGTIDDLSLAPHVEPGPDPTATPEPQPTATVTVTAPPEPQPTATVTVTAPPPPQPTQTAQPGPPAGGGDLYMTPGFHQVNGRSWFTQCEPYSQTFRCRTDIWATQARHVEGRFVSTTGWFFNNLTYLPMMTRDQWAGNPLAEGGRFESTGRRWMTECDTQRTGRHGCRSYIWVQGVVSATPEPGGGYSYSLADTWVFNNMVRFKVV